MLTITIAAWAKRRREKNIPSLPQLLEQKTSDSRKRKEKKDRGGRKEREGQTEARPKSGLGSGKSLDKDAPSAAKKDTRFSPEGVLMWPNLNINPDMGMLRTSEAEKRAMKDLLDQWKRWEEEHLDEEEEEQREPPPKRWTSQDLVAKKKTGGGASGQRR